MTRLLVVSVAVLDEVEHDNSEHEFLADAMRQVTESLACGENVGI